VLGDIGLVCWTETDDVDQGQIEAALDVHRVKWDVVPRSVAGPGNAITTH
jgi:hypothetical protein